MPTERDRDLLVDATSAILAGAAVLHLGWGLRVSIPGVDGDRLADAVVGSRELPAPSACFAVATALGAATALVAGVPARWPGVRRLGQAGVAIALGGRAAIGLAGRTGLVAPGPTSERFRRWDRRLYTPLCLVLCIGATRAALR